MKQLIFSLFISFFLLLSSASGASAFENPFKDIKEKVSDGLTSLYLKLPGSKPGDVVLRESIEAMEEVSSLDSKTEVELIMKDQDEMETGNINLVISGTSAFDDVYNPDSLKQDVNIDGSFEVEGIGMSANVDLKTDGETLYFKVNQLPALPFFDTKAIQDKWFITRAQEETAVDSTDASLENEEELKQAWIEFRDGVDIGQAEKQDLDGVGVFYLQVKMSDEVLKDYIVSTAQIEGGESFDREKTEKEVQGVLDAMDDINVELWIDRSTYYMRKVSFQTKVNLTEIEDFDTSQVDPQMLSIMEVQAITTMDKFNDEFEFVVPEEALDFESYFYQFMMNGGSFDQSVLGAFAEEPAELPELSPREKMLLEQYGVEVEEVIQ